AVVSKIRTMTVLERCRMLQSILCCLQQDGQCFLFHLYGVILRESADSNMVRKHLVQLLELSHQSSSDREGISLAVGITSTSHLDQVWGRLEHLGCTRFLRSALLSPDSQEEAMPSGLGRQVGLLLLLWRDQDQLTQGHSHQCVYLLLQLLIQQKGSTSEFMHLNKMKNSEAQAHKDSELFYSLVKTLDKYLMVVQHMQLVLTLLQGLCSHDGLSCHLASELLLTIMEDRSIKPEQVAETLQELFQQLPCIILTSILQTMMKAVAVLGMQHTQQTVEVILSLCPPSDRQVTPLWKALATNSQLACKVVTLLSVKLRLQPPRELIKAPVQAELISLLVRKICWGRGAPLAKEGDFMLPCLPPPSNRAMAHYDCEIKAVLGQAVTFLKSPEEQDNIVAILILTEFLSGQELTQFMSRRTIDSVLNLGLNNPNPLVRAMSLKGLRSSLMQPHKEQEGMRGGAIFLYGDVIYSGGKKFRQALKGHAFQALVPLLFHLTYSCPGVVKVKSNINSYHQFLMQALVYLDSPNRRLKLTAMKFIGGILQNYFTNLCFYLKKDNMKTLKKYFETLRQDPDSVSRRFYERFSKDVTELSQYVMI
ncbi:hypothetical protein G4228_008512, partial [Cervus hanglu yarkandensis]